MFEFAWATIGIVGWAVIASLIWICIAVLVMLVREWREKEMVEDEEERSVAAEETSEA